MTIFQNKPPPPQELNLFTIGGNIVSKFGKNGINKNKIKNK